MATKLGIKGHIKWLRLNFGPPVFDKVLRTVKEVNFVFDIGIGASKQTVFTDNGLLFCFYSETYASLKMGSKRRLN